VGGTANKLACGGRESGMFCLGQGAGTGSVGGANRRLTRTEWVISTFSERTEETKAAGGSDNIATNICPQAVRDHLPSNMNGQTQTGKNGSRCGHRRFLRMNNAGQIRRQPDLKSRDGCSYDGKPRGLHGKRFRGLDLKDFSQFGMPFVHNLVSMAFFFYYLFMLCCPPYSVAAREA